MTVWKYTRPKRIVLILVSFSSKSSFLKLAKALLMLALNPAGGSLVSLIDLWSNSIGIEGVGSDVKNTRKLG
jgi:hypothetical protein